MRFQEGPTDWLIGSSLGAIESCYSIQDLRQLARRRLPSPIFHHLDGGAETESTARNNIVAFDRFSIVPRVLEDVSSVSTSTRLLGLPLSWPVICAPTGVSRFFHPRGEGAAARAAAAAGTLYGVSTVGTTGLEEVAAASAGAKFFQLYVFKDRDLTRDLIERCKQNNYAALCLTVDVPVNGKRERDLRTGWSYPIRLSARGLASLAWHLPWCVGQVRYGKLSLPNISSRCGHVGLLAQTRFVAEQLDPSVSWRDLREMVEQWDGPFIVKGILSADDARHARDVGATAIIVSNHGGRQLDGAVTPIEVLPEIVKAVGDHVEVILESGVRRGVHILKAMALGAKACSIGRAYLYGLAAGGEAGVAKALAILRAELVLAMKLSGCTNISHVRPDLLRVSDCFVGVRGDTQ